MPLSPSRSSADLPSSLSAHKRRASQDLVIPTSSSRTRSRLETETPSDEDEDVGDDARTAAGGAGMVATSSSAGRGGRTPRHSLGGSKAKSCRECQRLKLKCSKIWPCTNCEKRGQASICPQGKLKTGKERIAELEAALLAATTPGPTGASPTAAAAASAGEPQPLHPLLQSTAYEETPSPPDTGPFGHETTSTRVTFEKGKERADDSDEITPPSGHLAISGLDSGSSKYFGDGGSVYLLNHDEEKPRPRPDVAELDFDQITPFSIENVGPRREDKLLALRMRLPSREAAVSLAFIYFHNVAWGTHIVDGETFDNVFLSHVYNAAYIRPQKLAVTFAVLALGALFDLGKAPNSPLSREYFMLCRACLSQDSSPSITFIQAVHLMATWLSNSGKSTNGGDAAWPLIGQAVRTAQQLGLHRDGLIWDGLTPSEANERRRVFYEAFAYDVMTSLSMGRPRSVMAFTMDARLPDVAPGASEYHVQRYKLVQQLARVNDEQIRVTPSSHRTVMEIDRGLRDYMLQLPAELMCDLRDEQLSLEINEYDKTKLLQSHTLQLHIHGGLLLLHRGYFARAIRDHPDEPLKSHYQASYLAEIECSRAIILVVIRLVRVPFELISRRWFFFFHAFSACVSLAAAIIRAPLASRTRDAFESLDMGVKLFEAARQLEHLPLLERLRQRATRSMEAAQSNGAPPVEGDLDLLGVGSTLHRYRPTSFSRTASASASHAQSMLPSPPPLAPPAASSRSFYSAPQQHPFTTPSPADDSSRHSNNGAGGFAPLQDFFSSVEDGQSGVDFDFDAFMSTLGVSSTEAGAESDPQNGLSDSSPAAHVPAPPPAIPPASSRPGLVHPHVSIDDLAGRYALDTNLVAKLKAARVTSTLQLHKFTDGDLDELAADCALSRMEARGVLGSLDLWREGTATIR